MAAMDSGHNAAKMMISLAPDYFTQLWEEPLPDVRPFKIANVVCLFD